MYRTAKNGIDVSQQKFSGIDVVKAESRDAKGHTCECCSTLL